MQERGTTKNANSVQKSNKLFGQSLKCLCSLKNLKTWKKIVILNELLVLTKHSKITGIDFLMLVN